MKGIFELPWSRLHSFTQTFLFPCWGYWLYVINTCDQLRSFTSTELVFDWLILFFVSLLTSLDAQGGGKRLLLWLFLSANQRTQNYTILANIVWAQKWVNRKNTKTGMKFGILPRADFLPFSRKRPGSWEVVERKCPFWSRQTVRDLKKEFFFLKKRGFWWVLNNYRIKRKVKKTFLTIFNYFFSFWRLIKNVKNARDKRVLEAVDQLMVCYWRWKSNKRIFYFYNLFEKVIYTCIYMEKFNFLFEKCSSEKNKILVFLWMIYESVDSFEEIL